MTAQVKAAEHREPLVRIAKRTDISRGKSWAIRAAAIAADLPQFTTITEFQAALLAIEAVKHNDYQIMSIQEHSKQLFELERREF